MLIGAKQPIYLESAGGGEHVDPRLDDVLAVTDTLAAGGVLCTVTLAATNLDDSKALFLVRHRNSDNDDTLESAIVAVPVDDSKQFDFVFTVADGEYIDVSPYADITGTVMAAINYQAFHG